MNTITRWLIPALCLSGGLLLAGPITIAPMAAAAPEHEEHEGHADHETAHAVTLTPAQIAENGITIAEAGPGAITRQLELSGEIALNADRVAHVVPRIAGVVREVFKNIGDDVKSGELMAVLDSRELAALKAAYLAALERETLARSTFEREKGLWEKKISAEQDYLAAKQGLAEASITTRSAEQQLLALGLSEDYVKGINSRERSAYTHYEIRAPFDGAVIEKHIALGESLKDDAPCFVIADLKTVWVDLNVHQKDLDAVAKGTPVRIGSRDDGKAGVDAVIAYVGPVMGEQTRTAVARIVLPNEDGRWRPGQFVTASVLTDRQPVAVMVPKAAVQTIDGDTCVFVQTGEGFVAAPVTLCQTDALNAEVADGLAAGQKYVAEGAFVLKAAMAKGELGHEH